MEIIKIDVIQRNIIKTFSDNTKQTIKIDELEGEPLALINSCMVCIQEKHTDYEFISLNIDNPVTRLIYFFNSIQFKEYMYEELPQEAKDLFTAFITMCEGL